MIKFVTEQFTGGRACFVSQFERTGQSGSRERGMLILSSVLSFPTAPASGMIPPTLRLPLATELT